MNKKILLLTLLLTSGVVVAGSIYERIGANTVLIGQGQAVSQSLSFDTGHGASNAGMSSDSAADLSLSAGGFSPLTVKASSGNIGIGTTNPGTAALAVIGGNVGIATTSPGAPLEVHSSNEAIRLSSTTTGAAATDIIEFHDSDGTLRGYVGDASGADTDIYLLGESELHFQTGAGLTRMTIDGSGNVSIGTTSPGSLFHVSGSGESVRLSSATTGSAATDWIGFNDSDGTLRGYVGDASGADTDIYLLGESGLQLQTSTGVTRMRIDASGNVGIGTTAPAAPVEFVKETVIDATGGQVPFTNTQLTTVGSTSDSSSYAFVAANTTGQIFVVRDDTHVGINTTSPSQSLEVNGSAQIDNALVVSGTATVNSAGGNVPHACHQVQVSGSSSIDATATCSGSEILTGGGCYCLGIGPMQSSYAVSSNSWQCICSSSGSPTAQAICCAY